METKKEMSERKKKLLVKALGDLSEYRCMYWSYDRHERKWNAIGELDPPIKEPPPADEVNKNEWFYCYCNTAIRHHILIRHVITEEFYFIGNVCMRRFMGKCKGRPCIDCNEPHRCQTTRCAECRVECEIHKEYHADNSSCTREYCRVHDEYHKNNKVCPIEAYLGNSPSFNSKYSTVKDCFRDSRYMNWLLDQGWFQRKREFRWFRVYLDTLKAK